MKTERLVHMANQIADFFAAYPREEAVAGVADHLKKFWDPRMRTALISHAQSGGAGLRDLVRAAIPKLDSHREGRAGFEVRQPPDPSLPR